MPPKPWKTLSTREIYKNNWMSLREDIAELPNGNTTIYGVCDFGECVGILPFVDDDHVVMVRQYRYIQQENHRWEMPTGGMKSDEKPEEAAQRELSEEIGYRANRLTHINTHYTSKSICDETAHIFLAYDLERHHLPPDETEFLDIEIFAFQDVLKMVREGDIRDAMTIIAVLHTALMKQGF
jgi:ADP-ribose pyrophosphatase